MVKEYPQTDITAHLARFDTLLRESLAHAQEKVAEAVDDAWSQPGASPYREALLADVTRAYQGAEQELAGAIDTAWRGEQNLAHRSVVVRRAVADYAARLALRNHLSVLTAVKASDTQAVLDDAQRRLNTGEDARLRWVASMDGKDPRSCIWCRRLHGIEVAPGDQFPHPLQVGRRRPPKLYLLVLYGPPLHPRCRCRLVVVSERPPVPSPPGPSSPVEGPGDFISSDTIRAMPEEDYSKLHHFLRSALHELGQVIQRLLHPYG